MWTLLAYTMAKLAATSTYTNAFTHFDHMRIITVLNMIRDHSVYHFPPGLRVQFLWVQALHPRPPHP